MQLVVLYTTKQFNNSLRNEKIKKQLTVENVRAGQAREWRRAPAHVARRPMPTPMQSTPALHATHYNSKHTIIIKMKTINNNNYVLKVCCANTWIVDLIKHCQHALKSSFQLCFCKSNLCV
jgi:hypothetical protein